MPYPDVKDSTLFWAIRGAWLAGQSAGQCDSARGALFRSAFPAADEHGLVDGKPETKVLRTAFVEGYLSALPPDGVKTDEHNFVL